MLFCAMFGRHPDSPETTDGCPSRMSGSALNRGASRAVRPRSRRMSQARTSCNFISCFQFFRVFFASQSMPCETPRVPKITINGEKQGLARGFRTGSPDGSISRCFSCDVTLLVSARWPRMEDRSSHSGRTGPVVRRVGRRATLPRRSKHSLSYS